MPNSRLSKEDLSSFNYSALQQLAKENGVRANLKQVVLVEALSECFSSDGDNDENQDHGVSYETARHVSASDTQKSGRKSRNSAASSRKSMSVRKSARKSARLPATPLAESFNVAEQDVVSPIVNTAGDSHLGHSSSFSDLATELASPMLVQKMGKPRRSTRSTAAALASEERDDSELVSDSEQTADVDSCQILNNDNSGAGTSNIGVGNDQKDTSMEDAIQQQIAEAQSEIASSVTNMSPGERERLLAEIHSDLAGKRAAEGPGVSSVAAKSSRFFPSVRKGKLGAKQNSKLTPSGKNWDKIHGKQFSKMKSIDDYLEEKRLRHEALVGHSARKATDADSRKDMARKTPLGSKKTRLFPKPASQFLSPGKQNLPRFQPKIASVKKVDFKFGVSPSIAKFTSVVTGSTTKKPVKRLMLTDPQETVVSAKKTKSSVKSVPRSVIMPTDDDDDDGREGPLSLAGVAEILLRQNVDKSIVSVNNSIASTAGFSANSVEDQDTIGIDDGDALVQQEKENDSTNEATGSDKFCDGIASGLALELENAEAIGGRTENNFEELPVEILPNNVSESDDSQQGNSVVSSKSVVSDSKSKKSIKDSTKSKAVKNTVEKMRDDRQVKDLPSPHAGQPWNRINRRKSPRVLNVVPKKAAAPLKTVRTVRPANVETGTAGRVILPNKPAVARVAPVVKQPLQSKPAGAVPRQANVACPVRPRTAVAQEPKKLVQPVVPRVAMLAAPAPPVKRVLPSSASKRANFDLGASLGRKLTYKPYTGALKKFEDTRLKTTAEPVRRAILRLRKSEARRSINRTEIGQSRKSRREKMVQDRRNMK